jgi:protein-S-isoprenylcysteine O-methyltransferase Ste14
LGGLFLACGSTICLVYVLVIVVPLNVFRARLEEVVLQGQLGETYHKYRAGTFF